MNTPNFKKECNEYLQEVDVVKVCFDTFDYLNAELSKHDFYFNNLAFYRNGSGGTAIGTLIDGFLPGKFSSNSNHTFVHGKDRTEPDLVCIDCSRLNGEIKTSGQGHYLKNGKYSKQRMVGSKTNAGRHRSAKSTKYTNDDYHFYVFIAYHIPRNENEKLIINKIELGMLKASDWMTSDDSKNSGSAYIKEELHKKQFFTIYSRF